jgi:hypothetical protein
MWAWNGGYIIVRFDDGRVTGKHFSEGRTMPYSTLGIILSKLGL